MTVPRPRKKPVKRQKTPDAEPVFDNEPGETAPDPTEGDAQDDTAVAEETAEDTEDNSLPADTVDTPPWEDTSQKEEPSDKPAEPLCRTEALSAYPHQG